MKIPQKKKIQKCIRLLIVDDVIDVLNATAINLDSKGYDVLKTQNGQEAIDVFKKEKIDIVILDYFMPQMDGKEVIEKIREIDKQVYIILNTGYSHDLPPEKTLEELNIQAYNDKNCGARAMYLNVLMAEKLIKQRQEIDRLNAEKLRTLEAIVGGVAHNLRTPITCIAGATEFLEEMHNDEYSEKWLKTIKESNIYIDNVIRRLKDMLKNQEINETMLVSALFYKIERLTNTKLELDIEEDFEICGDITVLGQVLINCIENSVYAYKERKNDGKIIIGAKKVDSGIVLWVEDFAGGIEEKDMNLLLKGMHTTKGKYGTGIGLYASKLMIKSRFNGLLEIESKAGDGTKVIIYL